VLNQWEDKHRDKAYKQHQDAGNNDDKIRLHSFYLTTHERINLKRERIKKRKEKANFLAGSV